MMEVYVAMNTGKLPPNTNAVIPYLIVNDVDAAVKFYETAFGFNKHVAMPGPDGKVVHAEMVHGNCMIMLGMYKEGQDCGMSAPRMDQKPSSTIYCYVEDVDKFFAHAKANGARPKQEPTDMFYGDRTCSLIDPFGHHWGFATHVKTMKPEEMKAAMEKMMKEMAHK